MGPTTWTTVGADTHRTFKIGELSADRFEGNRFFAQALTLAWDGSLYEAWGTAMLPTFEAARDAVRNTWSV